MKPDKIIFIYEKGKQKFYMNNYIATAIMSVIVFPIVLWLINRNRELSLLSGAIQVAFLLLAVIITTKLSVSRQWKKIELLYDEITKNKKNSQ